MYYATLTEVRQYLKLETAETSDDALLTSFIRGACAFADKRLGDVFYPYITTKYFDVPLGRKLIFNDHLLSLTSITNGDSTSISTSDVTLYPANLYPKYGMSINLEAGQTWTSDNDGNQEQVIA